MPCVIGTAGHIDHGKTALVRALTGMDTDSLSEEKRRGLSIELGFAFLELPGVRAAVVDVPGHERFIRNMLAGATGIDLVLFCVAANDGVMPQTREHLEILHLLGVKRGVVVITKSDLVGEARLGEVRADIEKLLSGTALASAPVCPVSTLTGSGIEELKGLLNSICTGVSSGTETRSAGLLRLPVDRAFSIKGFGTIVTGTVASGGLKKGDGVLLFSTNTSVGMKTGGVRIKEKNIRVRGIQSLFRDVQSVGAGERAALNLTGVSRSDIARGDIVVSEELRGAGSGIKTLDSSIEVLGSVKRALKDGALLKLHHQTSETLATVRLFTGNSGNSGRLGAPGQKLYARLRLKEPMLMLRGDRFILRDPSIARTIGGGRVLMPYFSDSLKTGFKDVDFESLESEEPSKALVSLLKGRSPVIDLATASLMLNLNSDELGALTSSDSFFLVGNDIMRAETAGAIKAALVEILQSHHHKHPGDLGIRLEGLGALVGSSVYGGSGLAKDVEGATRGAVKKSLMDRSLMDRLLGEGFVDSMVSDGVLRREGPYVAMADHSPSSGGVDSEVEEAVLGALGSGFETIKLEGLVKLPFEKKSVERVVEYLEKRSLVVKLKAGLFMNSKAALVARERLEAYLNKNGSIKAAEFRDILGCGRKLAIELLEYFDKEKVTLRKGDVRTLR